MRSFRIGSVFGIPIQLDLTFLLVLPLFAYIIGTQTGLWVDTLNSVFGTDIALGGLANGGTSFVLGTAAALGLFASVLLHELGHSVVAMRYGFPIASITLWLFGGIAQLTEMPEDWKQELYIAIAGPVVSVGLGVGLAALFLVLPGGTVAGSALLFVVGYLAITNLALAGFNLLPGFPMDGGRVLRALLARTRPYAQATQIAAEVGKAFALLLGLVGLFVGFNIFLIGVAFFIYIGASSEAQQTITKAAFEGVQVRDVMTPADRVTTVPATASVSDLVETMFRERHTGYPVTRDGRVVGLVTLEDAKRVKEVERDAYRVEEVMTTDLITVDPDEDAMDALSRMGQHGVGRLLVMERPDVAADATGGFGWGSAASDAEEFDDPEGLDDFADADAPPDGEFVGLITRTDLMTALDIIRSSGSLDPRGTDRRDADGPLPGADDGTARTPDELR
ncbi:site-2 protease family protein [Halomarina litorea]|uniref:site-2 protease family protein n=1 Tax=Halomarina litorea TaxID=2961595 RepID=UPI0020C26F25|nr:site-2 protease family protein [Halomarina sp. BCD28]